MKKTDLPGKKRIIVSLIVLVALTPVLVLSMEFLGVENLLTSMMMIISAILILKAGIQEKPAVLFVHALVMNLGCGLAASLVQLNLWTGIAINLVLIFFQTSVLFRDKGMQVFFPFHLAYIYMMACSPVEFGNLGPRIILLVIGALLCFGAQAVSWQKQKKAADGKGADSSREINSGHEKPKLKRLFDVHSVRFSFALRRTLGVTAAWFVVACFDIEYGKWLILSVSSIITPYIPAAADKLKKRFAGCLSGAVIFFIAFALTGNMGVHIAVMAFAMYGSILFYSKYAIRYGCTTVMSLAAAALSEPETMVFAIEKPLYVIIGGVAALIINRLILPHRGEE